jgi:hypothetical protein
MSAIGVARNVWWRKKKANWFVRAARVAGRSRKLTLFGGAVAVIGGAGGVRRMVRG